MRGINTTKTPTNKSKVISLFFPLSGLKYSKKRAKLKPGQNWIGIEDGGGRYQSCEERNVKTERKETNEIFVQFLYQLPDSFSACSLAPLRICSCRLLVCVHHLTHLFDLTSASLCTQDFHKVDSVSLASADDGGLANSLQWSRVRSIPRRQCEFGA